MQIDVVLATFNRAKLLHHAINSFVRSLPPANCTARLVVVDNNSKDETRHIVESAQTAYPDQRIDYVFEPRQGKAHALNVGIDQSNADIIGFFDDDEQITPDWLSVVHQAFSDPALAFVGGPVLPDWSSPPPSWLPSRTYGGVLSLVNNGNVPRRYGEAGFPGMLIGANAAIRRTTLLCCGPYLTRFKWAEDRHMYARLLAGGFVGYYLPKLIVYHHIPERRLTKRYFRQWAHAEGRTDGAMPPPLEATLPRQFLGIPLWMWRQAISSASTMIHGHLPGRIEAAEVFTAELNVRKFLSFCIERNVPFIPQSHFDRT